MLSNLSDLMTVSVRLGGVFAFNSTAGETG